MSSDVFDVIRFSPALDADGAANAETAAWFTAALSGFHEGKPSPEKLTRMAQNVIADGRVFTAVFDPESPSGAAGLDGGSRPVATYATLTQSFTLGEGRSLDAHLVTSVTVRATHRRRGILRRLITEDLTAAADRGVPIALLTASEATIYRRFGFGKAVWTRDVTVGTGPRFGLTTKPTGRVEVVDAAWLADRLATVFGRFHSVTAGSVDRQSSYPSGSLDSEDLTLTPGPKVAAAVHLDTEGELDGYVTFTAKEQGDAVTLEVHDFVAATTNARLALWDHLGHVDLADSVHYDSAPDDEPLAWALNDSRLLKVTSVDDALWSRVLDPVRVFEARPYVAHATDAVTIDVTDALGFAGGTFRLEVAGGSGRVTRLGDGTGTGAAGEHTAADGTALETDGPRLALDVSALASLVLGTVHPSLLVRAGLAELVGDDHTDGGTDTDRGTDGGRSTRLARLDAVFAATATPYCITHF